MKTKQISRLPGGCTTTAQLACGCLKPFSLKQVATPNDPATLSPIQLTSSPACPQNPNGYRGAQMLPLPSERSKTTAACKEQEKTHLLFATQDRIEKINEISTPEQLAGARPALTSGGAGDAAAALSQAGAVHHHPALVGLLPGLTHHVRGPGSVVVASLGCEREEGKSPPRALSGRGMPQEAATCPDRAEGEGSHHLPTGLQVHSPFPLPRHTHSSM